MQKFIKTDSVETKDALIKMGFVMIPSNESNIFVFLNDNTKVMKFDGIDNSKIKFTYTNMLCI